MSEAQMGDEIITALLAGTDTTSTIMGWAFHEIARHPEVERRVQDELAAVVGDREIRFEDLADLHYTDRVVKEVARIHSGLITPRTSTESVTVGGHRLPAGSEVVLSSYVYHRDPRFFPDPDVFDPDRWDPERGRDVPRRAFLPFGHGSRKCIGDSFAWTEILVVIAVVCSRWRLSPGPGYDGRESLALIPPATRLTMIPRAR